MPSQKASKPRINADIKHVKNSTINIASGDVKNVTNAGGETAFGDNDAIEIDEPPSSSPQKQTNILSQYDIFISYSHLNQTWVWQWLLPRLEKAGVTVCIDHACFEPGAPILAEIERAILNSRKTLVVLTPAYLKSEWAELENVLVATLDPAARNRRLLPIVLEACDLPLRLRSLIHLDFTDPDNIEGQFQRLLSALPTKATGGSVSEENQLTVLFPRSEEVSSTDECASWRQQRAKLQIDLRLLEQRMNDYSEATQVPSALVKRKHQLEAQIAELSQLITTQCPQNNPAPLPEDERCAGWRKLLAAHRKNLERLEFQKAQYGSADAPLRLLNQIDEEQTEIQRVETLLRDNACLA